MQATVRADACQCLGSCKAAIWLCGALFQDDVTVCTPIHRRALDRSEVFDMRLYGLEMRQPGISGWDFCFHPDDGLWSLTTGQSAVCGYQTDPGRLGESQCQRYRCMHTIVQVVLGRSLDTNAL